MLNLKKGEKAALLGFTGIRLSDVEISAATKATLTVIKKDGSEMIFDRKTGIQTNAKTEKYANKLVTLEDAPAPKAKKEEAKKEEKVEKKKKEAKKEDVPAPAKADKKKGKKAAPAPEPEDMDEDEDDEDDYEEV